MLWHSFVLWKIVLPKPTEGTCLGGRVYKCCFLTLAWLMLDALKTHFLHQISYHSALCSCRLDLSRTLPSPDTHSLLSSMDHLEEVVLPYATDAEHRSVQVRGQLVDGLLLNSRLSS